MKNYYSKIRELEKELERNKKIYSKLCRQRENLNDRKGVVMLTECMDLEIGETKARELLHNPDNGFTVRIGNRLYAHRDKVDAWLLRNIF